MPFLEEGDSYYSRDDGVNFEPRERKVSPLFQGDRRFYLIGGISSLLIFSAITIFIYNSNKPVDLGELPVIRAEAGPIKIKPKNNEQVKHQDKLVYDNISGDTRVIKEHIAENPEEPDESLSETFSNDTLSQEEKESIIREFDELAPRKPINVIDSPHTAAANAIHRKTIPQRTFPPINRADQSKFATVAKIEKKKRIGQLLLASDLPKKSNDGTLMVQVASVGSKVAAEAEYRRILHKNRFLQSAGKRIVKVDLGPSKGIKYRVQVGPFKSKKDAAKIIAAMKDNGFFGYVSR